MVPTGSDEKTVTAAGLCECHEEGPPWWQARPVTVGADRRRPLLDMFYAGLDLSRKRVDVCVVYGDGAAVAETAVAPDADGLAGLAARLAPLGRVQAAIESMTGARFVHERLEQLGWEVEIADAQKVKGLAPLACKTDRIDALVLAELGRRQLVP